MTARLALSGALLLCVLLLSGCRKRAADPVQAQPAPVADQGPRTEKPASGKGDAEASARKAILQHIEIVKGGDLNQIRMCFTDRVRDKVTQERVNASRERLKTTPVDDLVWQVGVYEYEGKRAAKVKTKDDRSLTTLVEVDGKWLADTVWVK